MKERTLVMTQRFPIGLLALLPLACNGLVVGGAPIGDPPPADPAPPSDPANPPGGPPSPVGAPPTTGAMAACQGAEAPGPRRLRLLTRSEYASTVTDLLGVPRPSVDNLPVESVVDGFDNNAGA